MQPAKIVPFVVPAPVLPKRSKRQHKAVNPENGDRKKSFCAEGMMHSEM